MHCLASVTSMGFEWPLWFATKHVPDFDKSIRLLSEDSSIRQVFIYQAINVSYALWWFISSLLWEWWGAETAAQRGCACSIPGDVQGQVAWGPGQPGLVLNVEVGGPACGRGLETHDPWGPLQLKPFCDSMTCWSLQEPTLMFTIALLFSLSWRLTQSITWHCGALFSLGKFKSTSYNVLFLQLWLEMCNHNSSLIKFPFAEITDGCEFHHGIGTLHHVIYRDL